MRIEYLALALFSGAAFSLIGLAYRLGKDRRVGPPQILLVVGLVGSVFFGLRCLGRPLSAVPMELMLFAAAAGIGQYLSVKLFAAAFRHGALSGPWCALSLPFIPTFLFARFAHGKAISLPQMLAMLVAVGCVLLAAMAQKKAAPRSDGADSRPMNPLAHMGLLVGILFANGLIGVAIAQCESLTAGQKELSELAGNLMMVLIYAGLALGIFLDLLVTRQLQCPLKAWLFLGLFGAAGSVMGLSSMFTATRGGVPSAICMTLSGVGQILTVGLLSVIFFGEKADRLWFGTIGLAVLAVGLANLPAILPDGALPAWMLVAF